MNIRFVYVAYIETSIPAFQYYDMIKSSPAKNIICHVAPLFYHHACFL
jgi:hypothetical protein